MRFLNVYANPFLALDHKGRVCGAFPYEPMLPYGDTRVRYIGATRAVKVLREANPNLQMQQLEEHTWEFSKDVQRVDKTSYYYKAIKTRDLIAADEESWLEAGGKEGGFMDPKLALKLAKEAAVKSFEREYGEVPPASDYWSDFLEPETATVEKAE